MSNVSILAIPILVAATACGDDKPAPASDSPVVGQPDHLVLPGDAYYPESITASADGTLYVPSLATGELVAYADGVTDPTVVLPAGTDGVAGITGVFADGEDLWLCSIDTTFQHPTELRRFGRDGTSKARFALAADQLCNDITKDGAGNVYVADSFGGTVQRLTPDGQALETWVSDDVWKPVAPGAFALDGIAADHAGHLFVGKLDEGLLLRFDLATRAVTTIEVSPPLASPDGLRVIDDHTLLVIEGVGRLTRLDLDGDRATGTVLADDLDQPTSVVVTRGSAWVSQGQIGRLFAMPSQPPILPFSIRRVDL